METNKQRDIGKVKRRGYLTLEERLEPNRNMMAWFVIFSWAQELIRTESY